MKKRNLYIGLFIAVVLSLGFGLWSRRGKTPPLFGSPIEPEFVGIVTNTPLAVSSRPQPGYAMYRWEQGARGCWNVAVSLRMAGSVEELAGGAEIRVGGKLHSVVLETSTTAVTLAVHLTEAWYSSGGERVSRVEDLLNSTPVVLSVTPSGKFLGISFPRSVAQDDRNLLKLAVGWEWVARDASSYDEAEYPVGESGTHLRAAYRRLSGGQITKRRYPPSENSVTDTGATQSIVASEFNATVGKLWVKELRGWEDSVVFLNSNVLAATRIVISLNEIDESSLPTALDVLLSDAQARQQFTIAAGPAANRQSVSKSFKREALMERWANVPFEEAITPLLDSAGGQARDAVKPLRAFREWLTVHEGDGPELAMQLLQSLSPEDVEISGLLLHGLAGAESERAQSVLTAILKNPDAFSPDTVLQATVAAGNGTILDPEIKRALLGLVQPQASQESSQLNDAALYAFSRLAKSDPEAQTLLVKAVTPWLDDRSATSASRIRALNALANAAVYDPTVADRANALAKSADADVRFAAGNYLATLPTGSSAEALSMHLTDPDVRVRDQAERIRSQ